jgi:hypothetical protein
VVVSGYFERSPLGPEKWASIRMHSMQPRPLMR